MTDGKKSILLYFDYRDHLALLSDGERGELIMALLDFAEDGVMPDFTGAQLMAFSFIKSQIERDSKKYEAKCERNRQNGYKGGRPKEEDKPTETQNNRTVKSETERLNQEPKKADKDKDKEKEKDKDTDKDKEKDLYKGVQGEGAIIPPTKNEPTAPPFITIILNDKSEYPISHDKVREWTELYPAVNIEQELRKFKAWCINNPTKRKTKTGILRSVNSWLSKEQDKGGGNTGYNRNAAKDAAQSAGDNGEPFEVKFE